MKTISREEIKRKILKHYGFPGDERELITTKSPSSYCKTGAVLFAVNGSPPKGFALYVPGHRQISFYDRFGKRYRHMTNAKVEDLEAER